MITPSVFFSIFCVLFGQKSAVNYKLLMFLLCAAVAGAGKIPTSAQKELRLIQSKSDIENPTIVVEAIPLVCCKFTVITSVIIIVIVIIIIIIIIIDCSAVVS